MEVASDVFHGANTDQHQVEYTAQAWATKVDRSRLQTDFRAVMGSDAHRGGGQCRAVIDTIPDHDDNRVGDLRRLNSGHFVGGQLFAECQGYWNVNLLCHFADDLSMISGQDPHVPAMILQPLYLSRNIGPQSIAHGRDRDNLRFPGDKNRLQSLFQNGLRLMQPSRGQLDCLSLQKGLITDPEPLAVDLPADATLLRLRHLLDFDR